MSPDLRRYYALVDRLQTVRAKNNDEDSDEEYQLLDEMDSLWHLLTSDERARLANTLLNT